MWHKGLWHSPRYIQAGLVTLRLDYPTNPEPDFIQSFRRGFPDELCRYTWVPAEGDPAQQIFYARSTDEDGGSYTELIVWDRLLNNYKKVDFDPKEFASLMGVMADVKSKDKRRGFVIRSEKIKEITRNAVGENGEYEHVKIDGLWYKAEHRREAWAINARNEARSNKGGSHGIEDGESQNSKGGST